MQRPGEAGAGGGWDGAAEVEVTGYREHGLGQERGKGDERRHGAWQGKEGVGRRRRSWRQTGQMAGA